MRIAYICADPGIPVFGSKGASVHVQEITRAMIKAGHDVTLFTPRAGGTPGPDLEQLKVVELAPIEGETPEFREAAARDLDRHLPGTLLDEGTFDLVYERFSLWSASGLEAARAEGIPTILEVNSPLIDEQSTHRSLSDAGLAKRAAARAFQAAAAIVCVSDAVGRWVEEYPEASGKVTVIPNGVDPDRFAVDRPRHLAKYVVGFVGTLKPWHDLETLVKAFAALHNRYPESHLLIVGDGPQRSGLEQQLHSLGLTDHATFTGQVDSGEVPRYLAQMDVAVAPYPEHGAPYFSPLKLYEYLAAGLPVLATDAGQAAEVIKDGHTGMLYTAGDARQLAACLVGLRTNPSLRSELGRAGRQLSEKHTWDGVLARILDRVDVAPHPIPSETRRHRRRLRFRTPTALLTAWRRLRRSRGVFMAHIKGQWGLIAAGVAAMFAEVALRLLEPWPLKFILDRVIDPEPGAAATGIEWADSMDPSTLLLLSAVGIVFVAGLRAAMAYGSTVAFALAGNRVLTSVRARLYRHLQRLSLSFHHTTRQGDLLTRVTGDVGRLQEVAVTALMPLVVNFATFAGMLAVMLWMDWRLTLLALAGVPIFAVTLVRLGGRIRTVARKQRRVEGDLASHASEALGAIEVVQAYSLEESFEEIFDSSNQASLRDGVEGKRLSAGLERRTDVFAALGTGLVLFFGARQVIAGQLTPGDLIVFITYLKSAFKPMRDIAKYVGRISKAAASAERIGEVLNTEPDIVDAPGAIPAPPFAGDIRFEGVAMAYGDGPRVVSDLDLHIPAGTNLALVGPSGVGKSSLAGLLLRFYAPTAGRVTIDGHDLARFELDSVRRQISVVLQDSVLFHASVRDNIRYGNLDASDEQVEQAARLANAHEFVSRLPEGYDTVLGERGTTLSGGERQRIAVARAALRDAPIVILDEPTTGLDTVAKGTVLEALERLTQHRTVLHITHDLATIETADQVVELIDGRVATVTPADQSGYSETRAVRG